MVLILTSSGDQTSRLVLDWLSIKEENYSLLNTQDVFDHTSIQIPKFEQDDYKKSYWLRKIDNTVEIDMASSSHKMYLDAFYEQSKNFFWLNSPNDLTVGKGTQLIHAKSCGLCIPKTIITKSKNAILDFTSKFDKTIIKLNDLESKNTNRGTFLSYTKIVTESLVKKMKFTEPCIIQEYIEKEIEIRTFFLNNECYSMAIFSQNDEQTMIDYRHYNHNIPNRNVPFKLPESIENRIIQFMNKLNLNSGSLDIILTPNHEYVFLEVNPVGQFGMVSNSCNYNLEEKVANLLITKKSL